ncbi:hypothetical protein [Enemella sp. A6]|uniref:hypothetical protein n=1 Tax=Enemella sp. A6 TaxID=3440152 RepID=UPI003EB7082F
MTDNSEHIDAERARAMLDRADQVAAATSAGASWPQIATMMVIGASSAMALVGLGLATDHAGRTAAIAVMAVFLTWLAIALGMAGVFGRTTKRGFSRRWNMVLVLWAVVWVAGVVLGSTVFAGNLIWHFAVAAVITILTASGAIAEARR